MSALLTVSGLDVALRTRKGPRPLVTGVGFTLERGGALGILGESGSGKSVTCRAVMGLLGEGFAVSGRAEFQGRDLLSLPPKAMRALCGKEIAMIMQHPLTSFDPLCPVGDQMAETLRFHLETGREAALEIARDALAAMHIKDPGHILTLYPHQLSGGMLQRVMIGLTLALQPALVIADEPTTALDSLTQFEIMKELVRIRESGRTSLIFISHDLGAMRMLVDTALVMHQGAPVEYGPAEAVFSRPQSDHARYLIETRNALTRRFMEYAGRRPGLDAARGCCRVAG
ncbi:ABC transporter ATP-binding protein [Solidesulfovibrio sp.]